MKVDDEEDGKVESLMKLVTMLCDCEHIRMAFMELPRAIKRIIHVLESTFHKPTVFCYNLNKDSLFIRLRFSHQNGITC